MRIAANKRLHASMDSNYQLFLIDHKQTPREEDGIACKIHFGGIIKL